MVVDVHFQVVDLAFESLELGKDGALLGDLGVHRLDRGHQRSNGQCNGRHHLLCHGWPHPSFNLFREGPNFVVLLHKDSSNFGEGYADGFEKNVVAVISQSCLWRRFFCHRDYGIPEGGKPLPATGCDLLKNHVSWVQEKDRTPFVAGWSTQLARGLVWGRQGWGSVEPSHVQRQWLSWGTIGMHMAALSRGGGGFLTLPVVLG